MLFDRYSYDYAGHRLAGADPDAPTLRCRVAGPVPLPHRIPAIAWRIGLDLNPLDVTNDDDVRWLSCLVWPDEEDRAERLAAAIASARRAPPPVTRGDLLTDLPAVVAGAPADATVVVYHSSVLYQVTPSQREQFAQTVGDLDVTWLTSESPGDVPGTARPATGTGLCSPATAAPSPSPTATAPACSGSGMRVGPSGLMKIGPHRVDESRTSLVPRRAFLGEGFIEVGQGRLHPMGS